MKIFFLRTSAKLGPNILDWLRSVYFSLLTSTLLVLLNKLFSMDWYSRGVLLAALAGVGIGLLMSVNITNRFKGFEKDFEKDKSLNARLEITQYYINRDKKMASQHFAMFLLLILSILLIGWGGWLSDKHSLESSNKNKLAIEQIQKVEAVRSKNDSLNAIRINLLQQYNLEKRDSIITLKIKILALEKLGKYRSQKGK
ncbi:hypothetical protein GWR56_13600 [Mucilaginibacter sp. 14171R-50]|uniref:hypothetical protein n=1 Tax=Mucilaginibacter sp. 14171R-50 TaxID=2703789 RepID=UPI00138B60F1|nr:hypothetical protein [Mucilaginibacter sp. 14171R-50]QHS56523.1 hypothetical protein GWR56_13600 [Mucilaginibacter sp. 14171R-50]